MISYGRIIQKNKLCLTPNKKDGKPSYNVFKVNDNLRYHTV